MNHHILRLFVCLWLCTAGLGLPGGFEASTFLLRIRDLVRRADCKTQTVVAGDGCASLAKRCGISAADFTKYNPDSKLCSSLQIGQRVCCVRQKDIHQRYVVLGILMRSFSLQEVFLTFGQSQVPMELVRRIL